MDSTGYLSSYGWQPGEPLKHGGLKRPILVSHKKDTKGLGHKPAAHDHETWWERIFDGQLKSLDVVDTRKDLSFSQREIVISGISKNVSPLYRMFVQGEGLKGTISHDATTTTSRSNNESAKLKIKRKPKHRQEGVEINKKKKKSSESKKDQDQNQNDVDKWMRRILKDIKKGEKKREKRTK